jgi:retron-type reverse transcriptase
MMLFDISDKVQLSKLLAVAPGEIDHVLGRIDRYYWRKNIAKRDGGTRSLLVPCGELKTLQDKIKRHILDKVPWLGCVHGGVKGRSVLSNALPHVRKDVVFKLDIEGFFPHVTPERVRRIFGGLGFGEESARILMKATTLNHQLPQGTSTSTALANLSLIKADWRILCLAEIHAFSYTRYVDDLLLSGGLRLSDFRGLIQRIIESEGFQVNPQKTSTMHAGMRQTVTQLVVNSKVNMPREWREDLRKQLFKQMRSEVSTVSAESLLGRVNWLAYLNKRASGRLIQRVQAAA